METIFKALADETRRQLLDTLRARDGQTLSELEADLGMTRFGVMKHLKVLEAAGLIVTRKQGRFKFHYLNAVPLQEVVDRWIEPMIAAPTTRNVLDLKTTLEGKSTMSRTVEKPDFMLQTFIKTSPEALWDALTNGSMTARYYIANAVLSGTIAEGEAYEYTSQAGNPMVRGKFLKVDDQRLLDMTFEPVWMDGRDAAPVSRNVWRIEPQGSVCKLTLEHYGITEKTEGVKEGWSRIAARLKTLLETGESLEMA